jgi:hypothetical protein
MITPQLQLSLESGEQLYGYFWVSGHPDEAVPGILKWSTRDGARLTLLGALNRRYLSPPQAEVAIHGQAAADGVPVTLPAALLTSSTFGSGLETRFVDSTLMIEDHYLPASKWKTLVLRTAYLHEWLPITGFLKPTVEFKAGQVERYSENWKAPRGIRVKLPDAELRFGARMDTELSWQPRRSIRTALDLSVKSTRPQTLDLLHERYAIPIANLMTLASGRPDRVSYEAALRRSNRAVVLRRGIDVAPREWRPDQELLFYGGQLPDFRLAIRHWIDLHRRCSPAIEVFSYAINQQPIYSAAELLNVAGALETYHRVVHERGWVRKWRKQNPTKKKRGPYLIERIEDLQAWSEVAEKMTGLDKANRELLVASRNHYAHLSEPSYGYTTRQVRERTPESIRRAVALMQACLLRELGFEASATEDRLAAHYRQWPIPT